MTMHRYTVPWQMTLGLILEIFIVFALLLVGAGTLSFFDVLPYVSAFLLIAALVVFVMLWLIVIPMFKVGFWWPLFFLLSHAAITILTYAGYFYHRGLSQSGTNITINFSDAVYFSITTWTTLGYGDFAPIEDMRLLTSAESLTGILTAALSVSFIWAWSKENVVPGEMTFLEGNRISAIDTAEHRIRTRLFSGRRIPMSEIWLAIADNYEVLYERGKASITKHGPVRQPTAELKEYPWKRAVTRMKIMLFLFGIFVALAAILGAIGKFPIVGGVALLFALFIFIYIVPFMLSFSRNFYSIMHICLLLHFIATIIIYAMHYKWAFNTQYTFGDALYFSFTTWATLGYGDIKPDEHMRLVTSCESISGILGISVTISYIWHFCSELMPPSQGNLPFNPDSHFRPALGSGGREWFGMGFLIFPGWDKIPNLNLTKEHRVMRWYPPLSEWEETNAEDLEIQDIIIIPSHMIRHPHPHPMDGVNSVFGSSRTIGVRLGTNRDGTVPP